ncbi:MAG: VWA domain-containing protein, partial [Caldilineaceae bacterium]|nr:VWA domain-containing protein [Caldilineaceae bacterium]
MTISEQERQRRWRFILGDGGAESLGFALSGRDAQIDAALGALYETRGEGEEGAPERRGGLEASAPRVARWLGDIREFFPTSVVRLLQQDAMARLNLRQLLLEPEILQSVTADVHLVATLMSLRNLAPSRAKATMRQVVQQVVDELMHRLTQPLEQAVRGSLNRALRNNRPRPHEINWERTIRANLKHYQPAYKTVIAEHLIGYGRQQRQAVKEIVLCVDQSGSMATSVVYASIFAAVLAAIPALKTQLVVFDTAVVDLTDLLADPVDVLFATQLG